MHRPARQALSICLLAVSPLTVLSQEQAGSTMADLVISTGAEGGGYWSAGERLDEVAAELGLTVENRPSGGSLDNLDQLFDPASPVNLAFAQADALQHYLNKHTVTEGSYEILENIGQECVFIITAADPTFAGGDGAQALSGLRLGIGSSTSGVAVTFDYMASLVPELRGIEVTYSDTQSLMQEVARSSGVVDAVMVVHRPREHSPELAAAIADPKRYRVLKLDDARLTTELADGRQVYHAMRLALPGAAQPVETICVRGLLLLYKEKLSAATRGALAELLNYHWMRVYATP